MHLLLCGRQFILNILTFSIPIWVIIITIIIIYISIKIYFRVTEIEEYNSWYEKYSRDKEVGYNTILYCPNCNKKYKRPNKEEYDSARVYFNNKLKKIIDEHNKNQE